MEQISLENSEEKTLFLGGVLQVQKMCYDQFSTLCEKCLNTELFLVRISLYSNWIRIFTE